MSKDWNTNLEYLNTVTQWCQWNVRNQIFFLKAAAPSSGCKEEKDWLHYWKPNNEGGDLIT